MGRTREVQRLILEELAKSDLKKKELKRVAKAKDASFKQSLKKALKRLVDKGKIEQDGKVFRIKSSRIENEMSSTQNVDDDEKIAALPIAARLRGERNTPAKAKRSVKFEDEQSPVDIDDEIRRLELELAQSSSDEESSDQESVDKDEGPGVVSLSAFAQDRIEQLPEVYLPEPGRYDPKVSSRRKAQKTPEPDKKDGLKEAVQEVLNGYKARSSERLPFYCRYCAKQYSNEQEFFDHKSTDFHQTAVDMERKATYCRLCRKQLTSPAQMQEHLKSRPHRERLNNARNRQRPEARGRRGGRERSSRQWT